MSKPEITTRASKQLALTYNELDQNFVNLRDSTIGFTVGSSTATIDLNSALTITAGTNVTLALDTATKTLTINSQGGVQSVSGTTGRITSTGGQNPILDLATTGVTAATYNNASVTVDSFGRITSASGKNLFTTFRTGGDGVVLSPTIASDELFIHSAQGTLRFTSLPAINAVYADLVPTGVTAGIYVAPTITVDQFGRITTVGSTNLGNAFSSIAVTGSGTITANSSGATATFVGQNGVGITANVSTRTLTYSLTNTGVTAGSYVNPNITVDAQGRITSISTAGVTTPLYSVSAVTNDIDLRNGTASTLLSTVRQNMVFKCAPSSILVNFRLPNYENMGGQYGEFTFVFVPDLDVGTRASLPLSGGTVTQIVLQTQTDNNITHRWTSGLSDATGTPQTPSLNPGTLNGTTTISGGQVVTASIPLHYGRIGVGSGYGNQNEISVSVQAPPSGGTTAVLKPIFNGNIIDRIEIVDPGSGYTTAPTFNIFSSPQTMVLNAYDTLILKARFFPGLNMNNNVGIVNMWILEKIMLKSR